MNQTDPLAQLRDIHLPDPISWWPLAPGWWLLAIIGIAGSVIAGRLLVKRYKNRSYRRQALAQLKRLDHSDCQQRLIAVFELLRQVALSAYPQGNFASLAPNEFVHFLQSSSGKPLFNDLADNWQWLLYAQQPQIEDQLVEQVIANAKLWVINHPRADRLEYGSAC
jgi:hypothetical protein